jgi:hypothetical protein
MFWLLEARVRTSLSSVFTCVALLTPYLAYAVTPEQQPHPGIGAREVQCRILFDSSEVTAASLDNCLNAFRPSQVTAIAVVVQSRVMRRLAPAVKRGEARKRALRVELEKRFAGVPVRDSVETRGGVQDSANLTLFVRETPLENERLVKVALERYAALDAQGHGDRATVDTPQRTLNLSVLAGVGRAVYDGHTYRSVSAGAAWTPPLTSTIRAEAGLRAGVLAADAHKDLYALTAAVGAGLVYGPAVLSLNGLGGVLSLEDGAKEGEFGAEAALALELRSVVVSLSHARTTATAKTLLNVGVRL